MSMWIVFALLLTVMLAVDCFSYCRQDCGEDA